MKRRILIAGILFALLCAIAVVAGVIWLPESTVDSVVSFGQKIWDRLGDHPVLLYFMMVILPAFAVPQSPFLVLAGMVYAEPLGEGLGAAVAASAVALNIVVSYFLTVGPLRYFVEKILSRFGYRVPEIPAEDQLKFSFLVRVTPVFPLCVQNYILGLLKVPFHLYLLASWTTQVPLAFAIALTAGAILEGKLAYILVAIAILLFLVIGLKWLRKRIRKDPEMRGVDEQMGIEEDEGGDGGNVMGKGPQDAIGVTELTRSLKSLIESEFPSVWVRGEISNLRKQASGHCYFSLKDSGSQISAVLFRGNALRAESQPRDGLQVIALGELSVYEPRGSYQIIVRELLEDGIGRLQREFERLKEKMRVEGLFESERKKSLPFLPLRVGVITSESGSVLRDMISVFRRLDWPGSLRIFPSAVQGQSAIPNLLRQIERAGTMEDLDLLVVARGGGSLEDLWCFNDESVARALADCPVPTISAIGHQTDFVLTDFVADLRKETPTGAAEWISSAVARFVRDLDSTGNDLIQIGDRALQERLNFLESLRTRSSARPFLRRIENESQRLDDSRNRLVRCVEAVFVDRWADLNQNRDRLKRSSPERVLLRKKQEFELLRKRLRSVVQRVERDKREKLEYLLPALRSGGLDRNLKRGFVLVRDGEGRPRRRAADWTVGEKLSIQFHDGSVAATVEEIDQTTIARKSL